MAKKDNKKGGKKKNTQTKMPVTYFDKKLDLSRTQMDAAELLIAGKNLKEVEKEINVTSTTIRKWMMESDDFQYFLESLTSALVEEIKWELASASEKALKTLVELMSSSPEDRVRLSAAKDVLDRVGTKGTSKREVDINSNVAIYQHVNELNDADLARLARATEVIDVEEE